MRCQHAIVVGDPLQIEPIVTLPRKLVETICDFFSVKLVDWIAPDASVQTLADKASRYRTTIQQENCTREVGIPLLVHRRCQSPMFEISNFVAYGGLMVQGTPPGISPVSSIVGPSKWIDVHNGSVAKWSESEGEILIHQLDRLLRTGDKSVADIFIISPFRNVANRLYQLVPDRIAQMYPDLPRLWWKDRIGTIHTFQGKEASTVFLVLGASGPEEEQARKWAAGTPNILNVAASRAQDNFFVIGSYKAWRGIGAMKIVQGYLPKSDN